MKFQRGHHPTHDMAAAGRKGRAVSPWGRIPLTRTAVRTWRLEAIKRAAKRNGS